MDTVDPVTVRIDEVNALRSSQFREDAGPTCHPVRPEQYQSMKNFYTATVYNKGAEVIRMIETLVGVDQFRRGLDAYFDTYDGQAVTVDDILSIFEQTCAIDLTQFKLWYSQSGTPYIETQSEYDDEQQTFTLTITQHTPKTADQNNKIPLHIPLRIGFLSKDGQPLNVTYANHTAAAHLLELKDASQTFTFEKVSNQPVLSVNQGFSAPIKRAINPDEALFLYTHDFDPLNRWDHGQFVMQEAVIGHYNQHDVSNQLTNIHKAMTNILNDDQLSYAQKAQLLSWPSMSILSQAIKKVDPIILQASLKKCMQEIAKMLQKDLVQQYKSASAHSQSIGKIGMGARRLMNLCLYYCLHADQSHASMAVQQYQQHPKQMTLLMGALQSLNQHACAERDLLMQSFKTTFQNDNLVMDKWFALSATIPASEKIEQLETLTQDPLYRSDNPNCIRSVWLMFAYHQVSGFHAKDGSGYQALSAITAYWDTRNPQLAGQLVQPLLSWEQYDQETAKKMKGYLLELATTAQSTDVQELLSKALANRAPIV